TMANGESRRVDVPYPKGHPKNRMSPAEVEEKFSGCTRKAITAAQQTKIMALVHDLEKLDNVADLMHALAVGDAGRLVRMKGGRPFNFFPPRRGGTKEGVPFNSASTPILTFPRRGGRK